MVHTQRAHGGLARKGMQAACVACCLALSRQFAFSAVLQQAGRPGGDRPKDSEVLAALAKAKLPLDEREQISKSVLAPGRKWRLVYVASKDQIQAARANKDTLPGAYVDGFLNYLIKFEGEGDVLLKREGISGSLFGKPFFLGDMARIKWPEREKRTSMVIESMANKLEAFGQEWTFPAEGVPGPGAEGDGKFLDAAGGTALKKVNFLYADEDVAVASADTGAIALYSAS